MTISEIEQHLKALQAEKDELTAELERLKSKQTEIKPWRAAGGKDYYIINDRGDSLCCHELCDEYSDAVFAFGNYYRTREIAEQDAKELALRGRVRQLRDALCEGYQFINGKNNYYLFMNEIQGRYCVSDITRCPSIGEIYFDAKEHAQTACDILNAEQESND